MKIYDLRFTIYAALLLVAWPVLAQEREIQTTGFTRNVLRATNSASFMQRAGFTNVGYANADAMPAGTTNFYWTDGKSNTLATAAAALADARENTIRIQRGTNYVEVGTFAALTNLWQAGDVVHLGITNTLNFALRTTIPSITFKGLGKDVSFVGMGTNGFEICTNDISIEDVSLVQDVPTAIVELSAARIAAVEFIGPMTVTNITLRNVSLYSQNCGFGVWPTNANVGDLSGAAYNCDFVGGGGWSGARFYSVTTNSQFTFESCRFDWSAINGTMTNVRPVALRSEAGDLTLKNCYFNATGYPAVHEQIGIYVAQGITRFLGDVKWGPFERSGYSPVMRILIENNALIYDSGTLDTADLFYNGTQSTNNVPVTVSSWLGSNRVDVAAQGNRLKLGASEVVVTGTNGISVPTYYFREMGYNALQWDSTNRTLWWPIVRPFPYVSNTFSTFGNQTNAALVMTNGAFITSYWATNGVLATNLLGTNWVMTLALNDYLIVSNLGASVTFFNFQGSQFDSSYVNQQVTPTAIWPSLSLDSTYTNYIATNYTATGTARQTPHGVAWQGVFKFGPGSRYIGVYALEQAAAPPGRSLNISVGLSNTNAPLTNNQVGAIALSDRQIRTTQNTNTIYCIEGLAGFVGTTFLWSGSAYTNSSTRYITNNGSYWRGMQGANERYTNATLFGYYSLGANGIAPPALIVPSGGTLLQGDLAITNGSFSVVKDASVVYSQNGSQAIVGGLTNSFGGAMGQVNITGTNMLEATHMRTNSGSANVALSLGGLLRFSGTNAAPSDTATADLWIDVDVSGTIYRMPLYVP